MVFLGTSSVLRQARRMLAFSCLGMLAWCGLAFSSYGSSDDELDWKKEQEFWAFQQPRTQKRPEIKNVRWAQRDLDYFVVAKIEGKGLSASPRAEKRVLIRRLTYDLTGLPPTPEQLEAFLKDTRPGAYERLVDRLIASPGFGERMASAWLPMARYAEDQAHQVGKDTKFFYPNAYKYREWVVDSFNSDLPYDQFVRMQLAADKLGDAGTNHLAALGFLGLGPKYYNRNR